MASFNLTNCNIVDVKKAKVIFHSAIAVDSGIITSISREEPAPGNSIDMQERYVLPGLFNLHSHLSLPFSAPEKDPLESEGIVALRCYRRAQDALNSGITTVRTVGERHRCDIPLKRYANEGKLSAPRIFAGGKGIGSSGGHGGTSQIEADGQDACLRAARTELGMGADQLKIFITGGMEKRDDLVLWRSPSWGKGQPGQTAEMSHGAKMPRYEN
ncbi:MAG: amidohydrolase family protein [Thaumarchaeota archaeon]|nr:amidohydrolase family protein [Nitrososphaerota archaeon]